MPLQTDKVILVNRNDEWLGITSKENAHLNGLLHRAISVFITNHKGEILLQQRAASKYHSANLWSNACCTHPAPGESTRAAARRRLREELGIETGLEKVSTYYYSAALDSSMHEHEFDHIYSGVYEGDPTPDPTEIQAWQWISEQELNKLIKAQPELFTAWFAPVYNIWQASK